MESKHGQLVAALSGSASHARVAVTRLAEAVFPHYCVVCAREGSVLCVDCHPYVMSPLRGIFVCPGCGATTALGAKCGSRSCAASGGIDGLIAAAPYGNPVLRELLRLHKYERVAEAGDAARAAFATFVRNHEAALRTVSADAAIVPVPMHPFREALRGFNQANGFAEVVAAATDRTVSAGLLRRRLRLRPQAKLPATSRRSNAAGSVVATGRVPGGARFVLVDDVVTSGATLDACAAALKAAGAGEVWGVTFLRG
jgi:predicted amidophosphoribosyltransferase